MKTLDKFLALLYPSRCVFCGDIIRAARDGVCSKCEKRLPRGPKMLIRGDYHEGVTAALLYDGAVRSAFLRYKFGGESLNADVFGAILADCVSERLPGRFDVITWAPLSRKRRRRRGYDQAELLAKVLGRRLGIPVVRLLEKSHDTAANSSLGAELRRGNVAGAYEPTGEICDRRILIVDDVYTTGATMSECARTLLLAGAESIVGAAFAVASPDDEPREDEMTDTGGLKAALSGNNDDKLRGTVPRDDFPNKEGT